MHLNFQSYEHLADRAPSLVRELAARPADVLMIDLRQNNGGDYVMARLHMILPIGNMAALNRDGRLYVLIGRQTFSAAMTNAADFRHETEALLVGEPTGARPNGFQELDVFTLPRSGLKVGYAKRRYRFGNPRDEAVVPDLMAPPTSVDLLAGRDAAVASALRHAVQTGALPQEAVE